MLATPLIPLARIRDLSALATVLALQELQLGHYCGHTGPQLLNYEHFQIPKKNRARRGEFRDIYAPHHGLDVAQRRVVEVFLRTIPISPHAHGFVPHHSVLTNALPHAGATHLLQLDIKAFFESITVSQVASAFRNLGANALVAKTLAELTTLNGSLPQGAASSPVLANLVCRALDLNLGTLAASHHAHYTRYADDLTFSGSELPAVDAVISILRESGFDTRTARRVHRGQSMYVTGLSVTDAKPRIPRRLKKRLRLLMHYCSKYGLEDHAAHAAPSLPPHIHRKKIEGLLAYLQQVEPELGKRLRGEWRQLVPPSPT